MVAKRLVAFISLIVALAAVAIAYGARPRAQRAVVRARPCAPSTRQPVAVVSGLSYDPTTMIPREIC